MCYFFACLRPVACVLFFACLRPVACVLFFAYLRPVACVLFFCRSSSCSLCAIFLLVFVL